MSLSIGLIGLPNVGKSTVFNALTGNQNAEVANYPFCTIQPNRAIVPLKDQRLETLQKLVGVSQIIYSTIEFVDIAGLVKGAHEGEGLGNQFLSHVRNTDALVHVVRGFDDPNVIHVHGHLDPLVDIDVINIELALADLAQINKKIGKLESDIKGDKTLVYIYKLALSLRDHLSHGKPVSIYPDSNSELFQSLTNEMRFLTAKPVLYAVNVDETGFGKDNIIVEKVRDYAKGSASEVLVLCGKLEEEMVEMTKAERQEFLELTGAKTSGLQQVIQKGFNVLGLISFFTKTENEVRAWNITQGTKAPQAAGKIHSDFEHGFIRAEVVSFDVFADHGSDAAIKAAGLMRSEGKDYIIQDGDVILFRFNV
jgi:GTP-binding protein YchF